MAKDPAVLFYTSDFISGTLTMSHEQRGKYILLLCLQHQKGHLSEKDMLNICGTYDEDIFAKFIKDENELYYNQRLENEVVKRRKYSESRRKNRAGKVKEEEDSLGKEEKDMSNISKSYVKHMENENENENINISKEKFEFARKIYPGIKRGLDTEFDNYKKHKDWKGCLELLLPAIKKQIDFKKNAVAMKEFVPEWKHFKTWIYNRSWEEEIGDNLVSSPTLKRPERRGQG